MDIAVTPAVERIARVLAGQRISVNGEGDAERASAAIDAAWKEHRDDALAVLKTLREPSRAMAEAGDPATWEAMVLAAIDEASPAGVAL